MESSLRELFIDMVVDKFIFNTNQTTLSISFIFIPKTGVELQTGVRFYCTDWGFLIDYCASDMLF